MADQAIDILRGANATDAQRDAAYSAFQSAKSWDDLKSGLDKSGIPVETRVKMARAWAPTAKQIGAPKYGTAPAPQVQTAGPSSNQINALPQSDGSKTASAIPGYPKPPQPPVPEELAPQYDPSFKQDYGIMSGPMSGVYGVVRGVERMAEPSAREKAGGAHEAISGAFEAGTPFMAASGVTSPVHTAKTLVKAIGAQTVLSGALKHAGVPDEYADLAGDIAAMLVGGKETKGKKGKAKEEAPAPPSTPPPPAPPAATPAAAPANPTGVSLTDQIVNRIRSGPKDSVISLPSLRKEFNASKEEFDKAVTDAADRGDLYLQTHDHGPALPPDQQAELVHDPNVKDAHGRPAYYVAAMLREPEAAPAPASAAEAPAPPSPASAGEPPPPGVPPDRKLRLMRGQHDAVTVHFPDKKSKAAYVAASKARIQTSNNPRPGASFEPLNQFAKDLAAQHGISEDDARSIVKSYYGEVNAAKSEYPPHSDEDLIHEHQGIDDFVNDWNELSQEKKTPEPNVPAPAQVGSNGAAAAGGESTSDSIPKQEASQGSFEDRARARFSEYPDDRLERISREADEPSRSVAKEVLAKRKAGPVAAEPPAPNSQELTEANFRNLKADPDRGEFVEMLPVERLIPLAEYDRSTAEKYPGQFQEVRDAISREGIKSPLIIKYDPATNRAYIGEGNTRLAAARSLGMTHSALSRVGEFVKDEDLTGDGPIAKAYNNIRQKDPKMLPDVAVEEILTYSLTGDHARIGLTEQEGRDAVLAMVKRAVEKFGEKGEGVLRYAKPGQRKEILGQLGNLGEGRNGAAVRAPDEGVQNGRGAGVRPGLQGHYQEPPEPGRSAGAAQ
jgi:hypothetical protein